MVVVAFLSLTLVGCSATLKDYENTSPKFDLQNYFTDDLKGWGLVKNWKGEIVERFSVELNGQWDNNKGRLYELFTYSDGRTQERTWRLEKQADGSSIGRAEDVIGEAIGMQSGFAFNWKYQLEIQTNDGQFKVTLDDWIYQINDEALISEAAIKKFGVTVGKVIVFIVKQEPTHG